MSNSSRVPAPLVVQNSGRWLGNDGTWSTFYVHIGTPPQHFHVLPSFGGQALYVPIIDDCARLNTTDCGGSRGVEVFQSRPSLGFQRNRSSTWTDIGIYRIDLGRRYGLTGNAQFGYDTVGPSSSTTVDVPTLEKAPVAPYATPDFWVGQLGLGIFPLNFTATEQPHSFLSRLKEERYIPSLSFGYQAGAPYRFTKIPGSLVLGGYDRARQSKNTLSVSTTEDTFVGLQNLTTTLKNGTTFPLLNTGVLTLIDTNVPELWLPPSVCDTIAATLGLTYYNESDRYALTDTVHSSLQALSPTFTFTLGTSTSGGSTIDINIPYAAFDLKAGYPIYTDPVNYFPLRRAGNDSQYALGRVFLQEVYLSLDWERSVLNVSQAVFTSPLPEEDIVAIPPKDLIETSKSGGGSSAKVSAGAIAGSVIGSVIVILVLLGAGWWFHRRRKLKKKYAAEQAVLPTDEKKDPNDFAPGASGEPPVERTDLELEGREVPEMYAPHGASEVQHGVPKEEAAEVAEMESPQPIYELPTHGRER